MAKKQPADFLYMMKSFYRYIVIFIYSVSTTFSTGARPSSSSASSLAFALDAASSSSARYFTEVADNACCLATFMSMLEIIAVPRSMNNAIQARPDARESY